MLLVLWLRSPGRVAAVQLLFFLLSVSHLQLQPLLHLPPGFAAVFLPHWLPPSLPAFSFTSSWFPRWPNGPFVFLPAPQRYASDAIFHLSGETGMMAARATLCLIKEWGQRGEMGEEPPPSPLSPSPPHYTHNKAPKVCARAQAIRRERRRRLIFEELAVRSVSV